MVIFDCNDIRVSMAVDAQNFKNTQCLCVSCGAGILRHEKRKEKKKAEVRGERWEQRETALATCEFGEGSNMRGWVGQQHAWLVLSYVRRGAPQRLIRLKSFFPGSPLFLVV